MDISDISAVFTQVGEYLSNPSRLLFAVAMTAPSSSWRQQQQQQPSDLSNVILVSSEWREIDFAQLEKSLALKLTNDDIFAVLSCVDAVNNLEKLNLSGCINVTGNGLEPLRGSVVMKLITFACTTCGVGGEVDQCRSCILTCEAEGCKEAICHDCYSEERIHWLQSCECCGDNVVLCPKCRWKRVLIKMEEDEENKPCGNCCKIVLEGTREKNERLREENAQLREG